MAEKIGNWLVFLLVFIYGVFMALLFFGAIFFLQDLNRAFCESNPANNFEPMMGSIGMCFPKSPYGCSTPNGSLCDVERKQNCINSNNFEWYCLYQKQGSWKRSGVDKE